jgi:hypothetical protein
MNELIKQLEFISYRPIKDDAYGTLGLVTFRAYGKFLLVFKHLRTKDGSGTFFCSANYALTDGTEKKYVSAISLDSRGDDQMFQEWIREHVNEAIALKSIRVQPQQSPTIYQPSGSQPSGMRMEASIQDALPF